MSHVQLFHLPGDIVMDRPGFKFFVLITTMLLASAVLSVLLCLFRRSVVDMRHLFDPYR